MGVVFLAFILSIYFPFTMWCDPNSILSSRISVFRSLNSSFEVTTPQFCICARLFVRNSDVIFSIYFYARAVEEKVPSLAIQKLGFWINWELKFGFLACLLVYLNSRDFLLLL
ncbi:hypothetical protein SAY86_021332 [Trapa natans]|uniref:Uncharacterized protein n=1 Tax=Trapa natans TaxID=22666 RepID=A0AAN7MS83_TRANT|nr:hypothetical protein SAY86_021332 [Trapa natans]